MISNYTIKIILSFTLAALLFTGCQQAASVEEKDLQIRQNSEPTVKTNSSIATPSVSPQTKTNVNTGSETSATKKSSIASVNEDDRQAIRNSLGELFVANDFKPNSIVGDFNGDGISDKVFVVQANETPQDQITWIEALPRLSENLNIKNMANGFEVRADSKSDASQFEKNKSRLTSKDKYALLVIIGDKATISNAISNSDKSNKFLLVNSLFPADFENKETAPDLVSIVKKGNSCLPKTAVGEGVFSGDVESGGKVIYFDGKTFNWQQCGD